MRLIMDLADRANPYIERAAPWELRKQPGQEARIQEICTVGLNLFRQLAVYLAPVLPQLAGQAGISSTLPSPPGTTLTWPPLGPHRDRMTCA